MSGRIVFYPDPEHRCTPGWKERPPLEEGNRLGLRAGTVTMSPPSDSEFPVGTRWQCDCGRIWVRRKSPRRTPHGGQWIVGGRVVFTPEHWWERRARERSGSPEPLKGGDVD